MAPPFFKFLLHAAAANSASVKPEGLGIRNDYRSPLDYVVWTIVRDRERDKLCSLSMELSFGSSLLGKFDKEVPWLELSPGSSRGVRVSNRAGAVDEG